MASSSETAPEGAAFPWILEHLLVYPGTYEIPLRTMYTLNVTTQNQPQMPISPTSTSIPGNAFPKPISETEGQQHMARNTAAAQLRANLMSHISKLPSQPTSLPPGFITSFVRRCFPHELEQVDFPQALTAMDYLKDIEVRRRREVVAALDKLGIDRNDIHDQGAIAKKYPGVMKWVCEVEEKERKIENLYTQVYLGLRRWTLINEMSLVPFNKANCLAMLNTLYPPPAIQTSQFVQPTAQLTSQILSTQRSGFFRYITAVEKNGPTVLASLMEQYKRPGDSSGWTSVRETLDTYLRMANIIIDECFEITGHVSSPTAASFTSADGDEEGRRKIDSGISFGSSDKSNRNSGQSHNTRPSTSSSVSNHSRKSSNQKQLPEKPLPIPIDDEAPQPKAAGSTLERIARELRKIRSRSNVREDSRPKTAIAAVPDPAMQENTPPSPPAKDRGLGFKRNLKKMRSNTGLRDSSVSRPTSRGNEGSKSDVPVFDAELMRQRRQEWEAQQKI